MVEVKILSICGSPRKGNSEAILNRLREIFEELGAENEIILLREKNIQRCGGCVEYCNHELKCKHNDDMPTIMKKMLKADAYVLASPTYFSMPPGTFKDFIDKCSVFYTAQTDLSSKKALVIAVGTDKEPIEKCIKNIAENFCGTLGIKVLAAKGFLSRSELKGNYNDIFENSLNPSIKKDLESMALLLYKNIGAKNN